MGGRRTVVIAGEPGIGKTRLAGELAVVPPPNTRSCCMDAATRNRCRVPTVRRGAAPLHRRQLGMDATRVSARVGAGSRGAVPGARRANATDERARAERSGNGALPAVRRLCDIAVRHRETGQFTILVLDDLHAADKPTLQLLRHVDRATADARLLIIGCYRDVQLPVDHPLIDYLADLRQDAGAERILLRGLSEEQSSRLIVDQLGSGASPELIGALHAATEGNPFFLEELVRHVTETSVPRTSPPLICPTVCARSSCGDCGGFLPRYASCSTWPPYADGNSMPTWLPRG